MGKGSISEFISGQLDTVRRQCRAIERGDLKTAQDAGRELKRTLPGLPRIAHQIRELLDSDPGQRETLLEMVREMKSLQEEATSRLVAGRDRLAQLLQELRKGRQIITRYHSGRKTENRLFDICG